MSWNGERIPRTKGATRRWSAGSLSMKAERAQRFLGGRSGAFLGGIQGMAEAEMKLEWTEM